MDRLGVEFPPTKGTGTVRFCLPGFVLSAISGAGLIVMKPDEKKGIFHLFSFWLV